MKARHLAALIGLISLATPTFVSAHDEGHGPKLTDTGQFGGVVTAVVEAKDATLGAKAPLLHKAELVRSEDGTVRVYFYDTTMKPLSPTDFDKTGTASLIAVKAGKETVTDFPLALEGSAFVGKAPAAASKPYNIDVKVKAKGKDLLAAFDNLD